MKDSQDWLDELELRIGFLRQWLNEDRITDYSNLVTNEQIEHWLDIKSLRKHILQEALKMIGDMEERETDDMSLQSWGKEAYEAFGRNMLRQELRNKFNDKYKED